MNSATNREHSEGSGIYEDFVLRILVSLDMQCLLSFTDPLSKTTGLMDHGMKPQTIR
jgi:hypothetical protein